MSASTPFRRRRRTTPIVPAVFASALILGVSACGGSSTTTAGTTTANSGSAAASSAPATGAADVGVINTYSLPDVNTISTPFKAAVFVAHQSTGDAISYTDAMTAYGKEHGLEVDLYTAGDYTQIDKQISQIQTAIATKPDILIVWATDPNAVVPALQQAAAANIPVINWVQAPNFPEAAATIKTDFVKDAGNLATALATLIGGKGELVTAFGGCGGQYQRDLEQGATEALAKFPDISVAVNECPADFDPSKVQTIVENALVAHPDVKGVLTSVVGQGVGAVNAIQAAGAGGEVLVGSGILGSCSDAKLVESGQIPIVTGVPSAYMGELGAAVALRVLEGLPVDKEYVIPGNIYTAANIGSADLSSDLSAQFLTGC